MPPAAIAIGAGALVGGVGAIASAKSQRKAAQTAADTSRSVANQNNALTRDIYEQNQAALSPFMARGNVAGDQINALLGLGGTGPTVAPPAQQQQQAQGFSSQRNALMAAKPWLFEGMPEATFLAARQGQAQPATATAGVSPQQAASNAFDIFRNSTGYQFRLGEGLNALNSNAFGAGIGQSGATLKALQEYGQNFASNEFGNYLGYLGNQQGVGLSGASALAGVGQNYANNVTANNNAAGTAVANAALARGANNPFGAAAGLIGGGLFSYGMGQL